MSNSNSNIYPKPCVYNCGIQIYWNTATSEYWEVFTKKKHICPNRVNNKPVTSNNNTFAAVVGTAATTSNTKPTYYSKKPWNTQPKPKMSNSLELLTGPIDTIQKKYEILSDLVIVEHGGKVHGSQSNVTNNSMQLIVYYEVPLGQRDEVKQKFDNMIRNLMTLQRN
ncbi:MAG TPA: hypothetical protein VEW92_12930 [Nitrososphaeraceae archaeon]|nr:hypothetical protein [Nitrososphaeraceae archaeon]